MSKNHEQFLKEINEKNNKIEIIGRYNGTTNYVKAKCKRCGNEWEARAYSLLAGRSCPKCRTLRGIENNNGKTKRKTHEEFEKELFRVNNSIELLSKYINHHNLLRCKCKRCGNEWDARAYSLLNGHGCPKCSKSGTSFMEQFIRLAFVKALSDKEVLTRERKTIGMELDILIPNYKLAIEPGNWLLHKKSIKRDELKRKLCKEHGIRLITIYDKFPKNDVCPFDDDCIVFQDDYNKSDHNEIRKLVIKLFQIAKINNNFTDEQWAEIEKKAYENSKSKTHSIFVEEMRNINPTIQIKGLYNNANKRLLVKCIKCGYEWDAIPASLLSGDGCRKCGTKKAHERFIKDENVVKKELAIVNPDIEIIGKYIGRHKPIKAKCKICGYEWEPTVSSLLRGSSHKNSKSLHKNTHSYK